MARIFFLLSLHRVTAITNSRLRAWSETVVDLSDFSNKVFQHLARIKSTGKEEQGPARLAFLECFIFFSRS